MVQYSCILQHDSKARYACTEVYSSLYMCVSVCCVYLYVCNSSFLKVATSIGECITDTAQQYLIINSLRLALFTIYDVICSPQAPLWHVPDSPEDKLICSQHISLQRETWINASSIVQLLAAELCS